MIKIITDYLDETAARLPDKIAYVEPEHEVTFSQVREKSRIIASGIAREGIVHRPVAVFLEKSILCIEAMYAVGYSGNFYTVLDTGMPEARIEKILTTLRPAAILTDAEHADRLKADAEHADGIVTDAKILLCEDLLSGRADNEALAKVRASMQSTDLMYVLFTSGSTGTPKGVTTSHRAYIEYLEGAREVYELEEDDRFLSQVPFYFVMAGTDIYAPAQDGCTLHIVPSSYYSFPALLMKYIAENKITFLYWVPSALAMVVNTKAFGVADISSVKKVVFGGEVMPVPVLKAWTQNVPGAFYINGYGSTEATDGVTYYRINREFEDGETLPIGIPYPNTQILILDENDKPIGPDGTGELCIKGPSLSYGYYGDPEKTAEAFVQNPLNDSYPEKIYRMGDLVRYNEYGELIYVGRADSQIQHMGHRVELGEIEAAAHSCAGVRECACLYNEEKKRIVLYYEGDEEPRGLGKYLKGALPDYMLPGRRYKLDEMPRNLNGKIDRKRLKDMEAECEDERKSSR
ncbi:MAG: amino acid adenylation domain-containing protein [Eubacterium sp.]|nr:amino acid adenylation domain-containing protein [Eubacterium sp.]